MSKDRYIWLGGEKIYVSEEVYRAYYQPIWREAKQNEVRHDMECSLDALKDAGFEIASNEALVDDIVADKLLLDELYVALNELADDEKFLIDAVYYKEKSEHLIAAASNIPQTTIHYRKKKILKCLRKKLKK